MKMESFTGHGPDRLFFAAGRILCLNKIKSCCSAVVHPDIFALLEGA